MLVSELVVERAARALERQRKSCYEWTDEEFEVWFTKDPRFTKQPTTWPDGFRGTHKEHLFREVRTVLAQIHSER